MHGKQSSKNRLKKRLLKRRQAMAKRWDKQSTRRHLPVYLLLLCKLLKRRQAMAKRWDKQSTRRHLPVYLLLLCKT